MSLSIDLLGGPVLKRDGIPTAPPRGQKAWALLAYLGLSRRPGSRRELAELLFAEADDPLGALRWSLSQVRKAIAPEGTVGGDPVRLELGPDAELDVSRLLRGSLPDPADADAIGRELLEGMSFAGAHAFESWLLIERRRLLAAAETAVSEAALTRLAAGEHADAVVLARRAVTLNPLDESNQELLVRCMAAGGDRGGAREQALACAELFRQELGYDPSPAVQRAADSPEPFSRSTAGRPAAARGLLDAGQAAIRAGATEAGITSLREACSEAARCREPALRAETLCALGIALVHAVRGWDGEGAASLHQALALADRSAARDIAATAHRELGWIGVVAGRREQAVTHLAQAEGLAEGDGEVAAIMGIRGMHASDTADYPAALAWLGESLERASKAGDRRQRVFSGAMLARVHRLRGDLAQATRLAERAIDGAREEHWLAYLPFPETIRAEVDLRRGNADAAAERFDHAFTLGCQLGDPCWEAFSARGLGLLSARGGDTAGATRWLEEARTRCTRWPDIYQWAHAYVLDTQAALAIEREDPDAPRVVAKLEEIASRADLRELAARALLHRARLGHEESADAAALLVREIDNPALHEEIGGVPELTGARSSA
jgi:DNA-binding SARP family transcriptional activator